MGFGQTIFKLQGLLSRHFRLGKRTARREMIVGSEYQMALRDSAPGERELRVCTKHTLSRA